MKKTFALIAASLSFSAFATTNTPPTSLSQSIESNPVEYSGANSIGTYAEVQLGSANSSGMNAGVNNAMAGRLDMGYKINQYFGLEGGFSGTTRPTAGTDLASLQFFDLSVKGFLPIGNYVDMHGQLGFAYDSISERAAIVNGETLPDAPFTPSFRGLAGVGFDFYICKKFAITANDYYYFGDPNTNAGAGNTNIVMGGFKYEFN